MTYVSTEPKFVLPQRSIPTPITLSATSKRICAVRLDSEQWRVLLICAYLPYEDGYANADIFSEELSKLESLIDDNQDCHVTICGDFNVDFSRN